MRTPLLTLLAATLLQPLARADKFWFESPDRKDRVEGSSPAMIEGVLLEDTGDTYVIRVVGGQLEVQKRLVVRVESDSMTVEAIEALEHEAAEKRAAARPAPNGQAQDPVQEPDVDVVVVEAPEAAELPELAPYGPTWFDPVIGAVAPARVHDHFAMLFDLEIAYDLTGDRRYVKLLRKLRRLH